MITPGPLDMIVPTCGSVLDRQSYGEDGKVQHRTLANLPELALALIVGRVPKPSSKVAMPAAPHAEAVHLIGLRARM